VRAPPPAPSTATRVPLVSVVRLLSSRQRFRLDSDTGEEGDGADEVAVACGGRGHRENSLPVYQAGKSPIGGSAAGSDVRAWTRAWVEALHLWRRDYILLRRSSGCRVSSGWSYRRVGARNLGDETDARQDIDSGEGPVSVGKAMVLSLRHDA
jgi:hypothetical protein